MIKFHDLKVAISAQFTMMQDYDLYVSAASKEEMHETYLGSFEEGTNPILRERTEHDCNCCKRFIRDAGGVLAMIDGKLTSIWDITIGGKYQPVVDAMAALVKSKGIYNVYFHYEPEVGVDVSYEELEPAEGGKPPKIHTWEHFHQVLPSKVVISDGSIATKRSEFKTNHDTLKRSIEDITPFAIQEALDLIDEKILYRGNEFRSIIEHLAALQVQYAASEFKDMFLWNKSKELGRASNIRGSAIGRLLVDLTAEVDLTKAVNDFGKMMDGYKECTSVVSPGQIKKAIDTVEKLGYTPSLPRRFAVADDLTINNVRFADRSIRTALGASVLGEMLQEAKASAMPKGKPQDIAIEDFMKDILPNAQSIEMMVENCHVNNLVSLVAPVNSDAPNMLRWDNNFSWSYNGEKTDSMRQRVQEHGGKVDGVLRFSIQWNDKVPNQNDLDAHCKEPKGNLISYPTKGRVQPSSGMLDVDIVSPGSKVAVENIIYTDLDKMPEGVYTFLVHNFSGVNGRDWSAEIEFGGQIFSFYYEGKMRSDQKIVVAKVRYTKGVGFTIEESMPCSQRSVDVWGIATQRFHKVSMIMNSPNFWDEQTIGNHHYFFMLDKCVNPAPARGFYNEFLSQELSESRKVFQHLSERMKTPVSSDQLSGLGFSVTQRNEVVCKVNGKRPQLFNIKF